MPRLPRIQFPGAIYHIVTRGDGRRRVFHDDGHYERFTRGLAEEVDRSGWIVVAYCWMPNHIPALIKTPEANLCRGMQDDKDDKDRHFSAFFDWPHEWPKSRRVESSCLECLSAEAIWLGT